MFEGDKQLETNPPATNTQHYHSQFMFKSELKEKTKYSFFKNKNTFQAQNTVNLLEIYFKRCFLYLRHLIIMIISHLI